MRTMQQSKACKQCEQVKSLDLFYRDSRASDGRRRICRDCDLAGRKAYYATPQGQQVRKRNNHTEHSKALRAAYAKTERGKAVIAKAQLDRYHQNPDPFRARATVRNHVQRGELKPARSCTCRCGAPALHYHHYKGYARENWLDVIPLCQQCHDVETWNLSLNGVKDSLPIPSIDAEILN